MNVRLKMMAMGLFVSMFASACGPDGGDAKQAQDAKQESPKQEGAKQAGDKQQGEGAKPEGAKPEGDHGAEAGLDIATAQQQGVVLAKVQARKLNDVLEANAELAFNEQRRAVVTARAAGWADKVAVYAGAYVKAGQLLAQVYSPEFQSAQYEYLLIGKRTESGGQATQSLLSAATQKLKLLGLNDTEIAELGQRDTPFPLQHIHSPIAGTVIEHKLSAGDALQPGQVLYTIAALDTLWANIALAESQLGKARVGQAVSFSVEAYPGERFSGRILSVGGVVNEESRTVRARASVQNRGGKLKPGMFARARVEAASTRSALAVPEAAVLLLQGKPTVFKREGAQLHAEAIEVGDVRNGWREVLGGLNAGDEIAVKNVYLLKSLILKSQMGEGHGH